MSNPISNKDEIISQRPLRIQLGSGDKYWPGFINVDAHGDQDAICLAGEVPWEDPADEIHAIHLFEHLSRLEVVEVLKTWLDALKPGGLLAMEMPSLDKIAQMIVNGVREPRLTTLGIFGDPKDPKPGMMHQWAWTEHELKEVLTEAGFKDIVFKRPVYHVEDRDLRVECRRP